MQKSQRPHIVAEHQWHKKKIIIQNDTKLIVMYQMYDFCYQLQTHRVLNTSSERQRGRVVRAPDMKSGGLTN